MKIFQKKRQEKFAKYDYANDDCDFCSKEVISEQGIKKLFSENWLVLASKYPYLDGNLLIIPKRHIVDIEQISAQEWQEFSRVLLKTKQVLADAFETDSFNIALNIGQNSGASLKHLHWQIVPRPQKLNPNALAIFNDFKFVTLDYKDLIKKINELK